jgi:hypothetical protein
MCFPYVEGTQTHLQLAADILYGGQTAHRPLLDCAADELKQARILVRVLSSSQGFSFWQQQPS